MKVNLNPSLIQYILVLICAILLVYYFFVPPTMEKGAVRTVLLIALASVILFMCRRESLANLKGQYLKHSTLCLIGLFIVFFQYPIDYVLNNISSTNSFIWVNNTVVLKGLVLSTIGIICFMIGYIAFRKKKPKRVNISVAPVGTKALEIMALVVLIIYYVTINPLYLSGYYGHVNMGATATAASSVFKVLIFASIIQKCRNMLIIGDIPNSFSKYCKKLGWQVIILVVLYLLSVLMSGDRGPIIFYGVLLIGGYIFVTKKKLTFKYAILYLFLAATFLTFLGLARSLNKELSYKEKMLRSFGEINYKTEASFSPQTAELAGSIRTLNIAVNHVPENRDYFYGRFQFQTLAKTIPFIGILYPYLFKDNSPQTSSSASFITWLRQGNDAKFGDGTSCIADLYLDFGVFGVIIGMFILGYLIRYSEIEMFSNALPTLFITIFFMVYLSSVLYIARSSIFEPVAKIVWIYLILSFNRYIYTRA